MPASPGTFTILSSTIKGDVFHHVVLATPLFLVGFTCNIGSILSTSLFFGDGVPGAIRRSASVLVEMGYMDALTQKRIQSEIYTYVRGPGAIFCGVLIYITMQFSDIQPWIAHMCVVLAIINGARYARMFNKHYFEQRLVFKLEDQSNWLK